MWEIIQTQEFLEWYNDLDVSAQEGIYEKMFILREIGPKLGRPYADTVKGSNYKNMKELRVQNKKRPFRIFFAFDPDRNAILLIGGDKTGKKRFYDEYIPVADKLYKSYLEDNYEKE